MRRGVEHAHFAKNAPGIGLQIVSLKIPEMHHRGRGFGDDLETRSRELLLSRVPLTYLNVQGE